MKFFFSLLNDQQLLNQLKKNAKGGYHLQFFSVCLLVIFQPLFYVSQWMLMHQWKNKKVSPARILLLKSWPHALTEDWFTYTNWFSAILGSRQQLWTQHWHVIAFSWCIDFLPCLQEQVWSNISIYLKSCLWQMGDFQSNIHPPSYCSWFFGLHQLLREIQGSLASKCSSMVTSESLTVSACCLVPCR